MTILMAKQHTKRDVDAIRRKLVKHGYVYDFMKSCWVNPDLSHYTLFETNTVNRIMYSVFVSKISHLSEPRVVRINYEYFYLLANGETV
jgi:hypothetical protein